MTQPPLTVALVGRPNVGKSTLFNRLLGKRLAIVDDQPGVTRDRLYAWVPYQEGGYTLIDTAGWNPSSSDDLSDAMNLQMREAVREAGIVALVVDAKTGCLPMDLELAQQLRKLNKTIWLVINKCDTVAAMAEASILAEFAGLGLSEIFTTSALQRSSLEALLESIGKYTPNCPPPVADDSIRVALIGRPNVGKSTLTNRLLGQERMIVANQAGTTRDSIASEWSYRGERYTLVDTAGARRKRKIQASVEYFSVTRTLESIRQAHVCVLLLDGQEALTDQDLHLLSYVVDCGRGLVVAVNKWDGLSAYQRQQFETRLDKKLAFMDFADIHKISAQHGSGIAALMRSVKWAYLSGKKPLQTAELNRLLEQAVSNHSPPLVNGRRIKLRYANPAGNHPPHIIVHGKQVKKLPGSYKHYLERFFRQGLKIHGTPIRLTFKQDANPYTTERS